MAHLNIGSLQETVMGHNPYDPVDCTDFNSFMRDQPARTSTLHKIPDGSPTNSDISADSRFFRVPSRLSSPHPLYGAPPTTQGAKILKTLLADNPQILTSTKELVHNLKTGVCDKLHRLSLLQYRKHIFICTADIEGFYTNVPIEDCTAKLRDLVVDHFGRGTCSSKVKADFVNELFSIEQNLVFHCKVNRSWEYV